jgi:hypothetical protein
VRRRQHQRQQPHLQVRRRQHLMAAVVHAEAAAEAEAEEGMRCEAVFVGMSNVMSIGVVCVRGLSELRSL